MPIVKGVKRNGVVYDFRDSEIRNSESTFVLDSKTGLTWKNQMAILFVESSAGVPGDVVPVRINRSCTDMLRLPNLSQYNLIGTMIQSGSYCAIAFYDENGVFISGAQRRNSGTSTKFTIPDNAVYFRLGNDYDATPTEDVYVQFSVFSFGEFSDPSNREMIVEMASNLDSQVLDQALDAVATVQGSIDTITDDVSVLKEGPGGLRLSYGLAWRPHSHILNTSIGSDPAGSVVETTELHSSSSMIHIPALSDRTLRTTAAQSGDAYAVAFYDENRVFISGIRRTSPTEGSITIPNRTMYVRLGCDHNIIAPESVYATFNTRVRDSYIRDYNQQMLFDQIKALDAAVVDEVQKSVSAQAIEDLEDTTSQLTTTTDRLWSSVSEGSQSISEMRRSVSSLSAMVESIIDSGASGLPVEINYQILANQVVRDTLTIITPEMFGAVGDGLTDDLEALQSMVDYCTDNRVACVLGAGKTYAISSTLRLNGFIFMDGQGATLLCIGETPRAVHWYNTKGGEYPPSKPDYYYRGVLKNLIIDANHLAVDGFYYNYQKARIENLTILNATVGLHTKGSNETVFDTIRVQDCGTGIHAEGNDAEWTHIFGRFCPIGIRSSGSTLNMTHVHFWLKDEERENSVMFWLESPESGGGVTSLTNVIFDDYHTTIKFTGTPALYLHSGGVLYVNHLTYTQEFLHFDDPSQSRRVRIGGLHLIGHTSRPYASFMNIDPSLWQGQIDTQTSRFYNLRNFPQVNSSLSRFTLTNTDKFSVINQNSDFSTERVHIEMLLRAKSAMMNQTVLLGTVFAEHAPKLSVFGQAIVSDSVDSLQDGYGTLPVMLKDDSSLYLYLGTIIAGQYLYINMTYIPKLSQNLE